MNELHDMQKQPQPANTLESFAKKEWLKRNDPTQWMTEQEKDTIEANNKMQRQLKEMRLPPSQEAAALNNEYVNRAWQRFNNQ